MGAGVPDEEGTGDEEDLDCEHVGDIDYGQDADGYQADAEWRQEYPVIRLSVFIMTAMFFTPMV